MGVATDELAGAAQPAFGDVLVALAHEKGAAGAAPPRQTYPAPQGAPLAAALPGAHAEPGGAVHTTHALEDVAPAAAPYLPAPQAVMVVFAAQKYPAGQGAEHEGLASPSPHVTPAAHALHATGAPCAGQ